MRRLSIHEFSSFKWSFFQDVIKYASLGFDSIGLWRSKVSDFGFEEAADLLFEMQMSVSSMSWAGGFTGSEGNTFNLAVEDGIEAVYQSHMVGADKLIIQPGGRNGHTDSHATRLVKTGLREMVPVAQDLGIQLLLEPVDQPRNPWNFMNRPENYIRLLDEFADCEVGLVLDLFHVCRTDSFRQSIEKFANRINLVQLSDGRFRQNEFVRCPLGNGTIPVNSWLSLLEEYGYDGQFEIELYGYEFENQQYQNVIESCQSFLANCDSKILSESISR